MKTLLAVLLACAGLSFLAANNSTTVESYRWIKAIDTGVQTWPRWIKPINGAGNQLVMVTNEQTFFSRDGIAWITKPNNANTAARHGVSQIYFNGRYWLMGGMADWSRFTNEVWSSADGCKWELVTTRVPWLPRRDALLLEFQDKLWLIGGKESSGKRDVLPQRSYRDAWQSVDGANWYKVETQIPEENEKALVFKGQLWLLGTSGVWTSSDGLSWRQTANGKPFSSVRGFGALVYDDQIWVFGGIGSKKTVNDVWSSTDGITWVQKRSAPWFRRGAEYSVVFDGKLWLYGGKTGEDYKQADDVWYMKKL